MPPHMIDRTGYAALRRVTGEEGAGADTVRSGTSASRDAEGAGTLPTPDAFSRYARATEKIRYDSEVTAVVQRTRMPSSGDRDTPTSVYRYYDRHGVLIYVGITSRGSRRNFEHNRDKEWWQYVATQEVEHYDTRLDAARRERALIIRYEPPFNRQHNVNHDGARAAYLGLRPHLDVQMPGIHDLYRLLGKRLPLTLHEVSEGGRSLIMRSQLAHAEIAANLVLPDWKLRVRKYAGHVVELRSVEPDGRIQYLSFRAVCACKGALAPASSGFLEINCKMQPRERGDGPVALFPVKHARLTPQLMRAGQAVA